jgi:hypothetical protein
MLEALLQKLVGGNDALLMLGSFSLLILLNFAAEMWVEIKNKDLKWNDIPRFLKPIVLAAMFLLGAETIMIPAARIPFAMEIFNMVETGAYIGVMGAYFFGFYKNLKKLGLKTTQKLDDQMSEIGEDTKEDI